MKKIVAVFLMGLVVSLQVRPVEPITMFGVCAVGLVSAWRTTTGKMLAGAMLAQAAQTQMGKKIINQAMANSWKKLSYSLPTSESKTTFFGMRDAAQSVSKQIVEHAGAAKAAMNDSAIVKRCQDYIQTKRANLTATRVWMQERSSVVKESFSHDFSEKVSEKILGRQPSSYGNINLTQHNTQNNAYVHNNGFFSRTYINDPTKTKEFADAKVAAAAGNERAKASYWQGNYNGLRNGLAGGVAASGLTYWLFGGKKKEQPLVVVVDRDDFYPAY